MKRSSSRLTGLGTTIFAEMTAAATATGSINLGQGFPDLDGPPAIIERAVQALRGGQNQYPPGRGIPELRLAIARHQRRHHGIELDPETQVVVTAGATEALAASILALVDPGDEVIVLEPYYDSYVAMIQMAGGLRRPVTLRSPDFRLPIDELNAAITPSTTAILLNSPHNPTGSVLTGEELTAVADLAVRHDLVVISDEVYEHLTFDSRPHIPISTLPGMAERTVTISSAAKTFSFTGWKVGWATGPADLIAAVLGVKQFLTYSSAAPLQPAIAWALDNCDDDIAAMRASLQARRDTLCAGLADLGFTTMRPEGTYFATTDIRPLGFDDGLEFCRRLPELAAVVAVPHQVFYDNVEAGRPLVRWAFCKQPAVIAEALDRLSVLGSAR